MRDRQHWPALEAENQAELLAYLGTAACSEGHRDASITWVLTGVGSNDYNGVLWARLSPAEADELAPALVERFRSRRVPALWHLDPDTQPADLAERLGRLGCVRLQPGVCMAAPLAGLPSQVPSLPGLSIERVATSGDLADWINVWAGDGEEVPGPRHQLYATLGLSAAQPLQHFLARVDGHPAGVAQIFLGQRAAGLYCVSVLPAFGRRGVGTALTLTALRHARALGYTLGVLGPSPEGQPMYARLGFELFASPAVAYTLWFEP